MSELSGFKMERDAHATCNMHNGDDWCVVYPVYHGECLFLVHGTTSGTGKDLHLDGDVLQIDFRDPALILEANRIAKHNIFPGVTKGTWPRLSERILAQIANDAE